MIYIHKSGSINVKQEETLDVKAAWKKVSPSMIRRTDRFIQLSLLGAYNAIGQEEIPEESALYMASGQGNLAVFKRLRDQRYIHKQPPKPVDFINSLSNTSGFYVAQFFGLLGKNLNVSRHGLVIENILMLAQADLELGREKQILLGGVDELQEPLDFTRRTLGLCDDHPLGEGSNWLLLSTQKEEALASIEVLSEQMDSLKLKAYLSSLQQKPQVAFGGRCESVWVEEILKLYDFELFEYASECDFYETNPLFALHRFVEEGRGELLFINTFNAQYRVIKVVLI